MTPISMQNSITAPLSPLRNDTVIQLDNYEKKEKEAFGPVEIEPDDVYTNLIKSIQKHIDNSKLVPLINIATSASWAATFLCMYSNLDIAFPAFSISLTLTTLNLAIYSIQTEAYKIN